MSTPNNPDPDAKSNQPISPAEMAAVLGKTIKQLNYLLEQIDRQSPVNLPDRTIIDNLAVTTNQLVNSIESQLQTTGNDRGERTRDREKQLKDFRGEKVALKPKSPKMLGLLRIVDSYKTILDSKLIIVISSVLLISCLLIVFNLFGNPQKEIIDKQLTETQEKVESAGKTSELKTTESTEIISNLDGQNKREEKSQDIPSDLENGGDVITTEPATGPERQWTPEQGLIASIRDRVEAIARKYVDSLIVTIEANFSHNFLIITIDNKWYEIGNNDQANLVTDIYNRAKDLNFYKLYLKDSQGNLIARSAVVGDRMIIVRN